MFTNVIRAHNKLSLNLKFVTFPGGTRVSVVLPHRSSIRTNLIQGYGIYVPGGTFTPPLREEMVNNLPPDYAKTVVYPIYREILDAESQGKNWTWCEVCPDAIVSSFHNKPTCALLTLQGRLYSQRFTVQPSSALGSVSVTIRL